MVMESQRHLEDLVRGKLFVHDSDPARAEQTLTKVHAILDGQRTAIEHRARFEKIFSHLLEPVFVSGIVFLYLVWAVNRALVFYRIQ